MELGRGAMAVLFMAMETEPVRVDMDHAKP